MLKADKSPAAKLDDYFPSQLATAQYSGKTYGLPWIAQPVMLYYNPKLFADAGVEPPDENWTWDDFKAAAAKLTKVPRRQSTVRHAFNGWPPIQMFIWQAGGEVISEDKTSPDRLARRRWRARNSTATSSTTRSTPRPKM